MTVSTKFAAPLLVLLAIALVPVVIYSTLTPSIDDCSQPEGLVRVSEISSTSRLTPGTLGRPWYIDEQSFIQRIQGNVSNDNDSSVLEFAILRVYGLPSAFVRPPKSLKMRFEANLQRFERLQVGADQLPVHVAIQSERFAAFFFIYDGRPVENPMLARLSGALQELVNGRRPLTSILIAGDIQGRGSEQLPENARDWLAATWQHYRRVCAP